VLGIGALVIAALFTLYIATSTVPVGEKVKQLKDLGGRFQLNSINGSVDLAQYKGKVVVLYFGFLSCSEVCPVSMGVMSAAFKKLPADIYAQVQGFFISVDPKRDDLESLNEFAQYFDPHIIGLTGSDEEINTLTRQYGVYFDIVEMESSELSYTVDHSSRFYIISPSGQLVDVMSHNTTPTELSARIAREISAVTRKVL
ncbi:MAG: SCO family protein, partial [Psychromonas sp.]|nr:SCO family protein [Psychromonas sp.]